MVSMGNILLIDDDQALLNILRRLLEGMNYCVETASSGEEGLSKFHSGSSFDLVLLDQELPGIRGLETILEINKMSGEVQIIMITAYATVSEAISAIKQGAYDYLTKPIEPERLEMAVERAMEVVCLNREVKSYKKILFKGNRRVES